MAAEHVGCKGEMSIRGPMPRAMTARFARILPSGYAGEQPPGAPLDAAVEL